VDRKGGDFQVSFKTNEVSSQNFEYDLVYEAEGFEVHKERMSGILKAPEGIVGKWIYDMHAEDRNNNGVPDPEEYYYDHDAASHFIIVEANGIFKFYDEGTDLDLFTWTAVGPGQYLIKLKADPSEQFYLTISGNRMMIFIEEDNEWIIFKRQ